jgi:hypothetical protein
VRRGALATSGYEPVTWVVPQWGNIAVFGILLLVGIVTVIWMIRALLVGGGEEPQGGSTGPKS